METVTIILYAAAGIILAYILVFKIFGLRIINSNEVGVIEKWWSVKGYLKNAIIALNGETGYSPDLIRGGMHFKTVLMYKVHKYPLITIPQGQIAYVFARDGQPLSPIQTIGRVIPEFSGCPRVSSKRRPKRPPARHTQGGNLCD